MLITAACTPGVAAGLARALTPAAPATMKLMVFGGTGHGTYLGCLSCSEYDQESLFNPYGQYGSAYSNQSILNHYSEFGSPYSATSACNPYASDPPVIVDAQGNYYGRLTVNTYRQDAFHSSEVLAWLTAVCEQ